MRYARILRATWHIWRAWKRLTSRPSWTRTACITIWIRRFLSAAGILIKVRPVATETEALNKKISIQNINTLLDISTVHYILVSANYSNYINILTQ